MRRWGPAVLILAAATTGGATRAGAEERVRVALLPIVVHSSEGREATQQSLAEMLLTRLGRDERLTVVEVGDPGAATLDAGAAREAARKAGAEFVVYGAFTRFGAGASLDLQYTAAAASGEPPRQVFVHTPTLDDLPPRLDGAAERLTGGLLAGAAARGQPPTGPEAVR